MRAVNGQPVDLGASSHYAPHLESVRAYSPDGVARLMERLQVVPDLKNVQLKSSAVTQVSGQNVYAFTIVSDIRNGRGAS